MHFAHTYTHSDSPVTSFASCTTLIRHSLSPPPPLSPSLSLSLALSSVLCSFLLSISSSLAPQLSSSSSTHPELALSLLISEIDWTLILLLLLLFFCSFSNYSHLRHCCPSSVPQWAALSRVFAENKMCWAWSISHNARRRLVWWCASPQWRELWEILTGCCLHFSEALRCLPGAIWWRRCFPSLGDRLRLQLTSLDPTRKCS